MYYVTLNMPIEIWDCNDENYDKKCKILEIFEIHHSEKEGEKISY